MFDQGSQDVGKMERWVVGNIVAVSVVTTVTGTNPTSARPLWAPPSPTPTRHQHDHRGHHRHRYQPGTSTTVVVTTVTSANSSYNGHPSTIATKPVTITGPAVRRPTPSTAGRRVTANPTSGPSSSNRARIVRDDLHGQPRATHATHTTPKLFSPTTSPYYLCLSPNNYPPSWL